MSLPHILIQGLFQFSTPLYCLFTLHWIYLNLKGSKVYKLLDERNLALPFFAASQQHLGEVPEFKLNDPYPNSVVKFNPHSRGITAL